MIEKLAHHRSLCMPILALVCGLPLNGFAVEWPPEIARIRIPSLSDGELQPSLWYDPLATQPAPLLVSLHSWSTNYLYTESIESAAWVVENGWVFIQPNYRGANKRPEACMSELAVLDVLSAVDYARRHALVDENRIYLLGGSGGGHAAMQMASRAPELWAGVSAWVGISDLERWFVHCRDRKIHYAEDVLACLGGDPTTDPTARAESILRSPVHWLHRARGINIDISHGIHDPTVPVENALRAFNVLAAPADRISEEEVLYIAEHKRPPPGTAVVDDPLYGDQRVLLRRQSGKARLTLFDAGHVMRTSTALEWLSQQRREASPPEKIGLLK